MPAQIQCPSCGKLLAIDGSKFGTQVKCPSCSHTFVAAKPGEEPQKTEGEGIISDDISIDMSLHPSELEEQPKPEQKAPTGPAAPQGKTCPSCGSPMDAAAVICPNCNMNVMTGKKVERREAEESEGGGAFAITGKSVGLIVFAVILAVVAIWFHFLSGSEEPSPADTSKKTDKPKKTQTAPHDKKNDGKPKDDRETRLAKIKEQRRKKKFRNMAEESVKQASYREGSRKWKEAQDRYKKALEHYPKSDEPEKAEEIKKRLTAVEKVIQGVALEQEKKWEEAIAIYKEAQPDLVNKTYVDARVEYITNFKKYAAAYNKAETDLTAGRWEEAKKGFEEAGKIADELSLKQQKIDARNRADSVEGVREEFEARRDDMRWTMEQLEKDKNHFGLYAAIQYYLTSDRHKIYADEPKAKLKEIKKALESEKPLRAEGAEKRVILTLKGDKKVEGRILEKGKSSIKFEVIKDGKPRVTTIFNMKITQQEEIEIPADQINTERARVIFVETAGECEKKAWYKVLTKIGLLLYYFQDLPLVQDKETQDKLVKEVARNVEAGTTLEDMLRSAVVHCEALCPVCKGKGKIPCTMCKQKGKILEICSRCAFRVFCHYCGAEELLRADMLDDNIDCKKCKKKFIPLGVKCPYCGKIFLRKVKEKPVKVVCPYCKKRGQVKEWLPLEKMPKASGSILCPNCRGTGKTKSGRCAKCRGRKTLPCPQCAKGHKGLMMVRCPYCRPPDFFMKCPECQGRGVRAGKGTKANR